MYRRIEHCMIAVAVIAIALIFIMDPSAPLFQ